MLHPFSRTELLIGTEGLNKLTNSKVAIFGLGGVGGYALEGLARSGVSKFVLVDDDLVCLTNINRQIIATRKTVGKPKIEIAKQRVLEINPRAEVEIFQTFYLPDKAEELIRPDYDYIIDAVDTMTAKLDLAVRAKEMNIPLISCMGMGNKMNPTMIEVADIYETSICPLAKIMRKKLRKLGVESLKVVYSKEEPIKQFVLESDCRNNCICVNKDRTCLSRRDIPGSISFVPSVAGLVMASEVVKDLLKK